MRWEAPPGQIKAVDGPFIDGKLICDSDYFRRKCGGYLSCALLCNTATQSALMWQVFHCMTGDRF